MKIRSSARFTADFPNDVIEDDDDIVQFGGRGVAEAIAALLRTVGYEVSDPEHQWEHGWSFHVQSKGRRIWIQISDADDVCTLVSAVVGILAPLFGSSKRFHAEVLVQVNFQLRTDPRFGDINWYETGKLLFDAPGAPTPVDAAV